MGIWPFSRRKSRRAPQSITDMHEGGPGRSINASEMNTSTGPERRRSRWETSRRRKSSKDSKTLSRSQDKPRTYSFSPGRKDSIRVPLDINRPPVPRIPSTIRRGQRSAAVYSTTAAEKKALQSNTAPAEDVYKWQRVPTLTKRKPSKKRKTEHNREEEIKAMMSSMPTRPAINMHTSGRPMKKDTKRVRDGLGRPSEISLPLAESIHSSLSGGDDTHTSYILSGLDMLVPRPTIRYSGNPRSYGSLGPDTGSRKRKVLERLSIPVETLKANKRIDDLADDLDAGELRELMERDNKRREKKKIAEKIRIEQRLARRQEKQRQDEATAALKGTPPPQNMERGVFGRDVIGLGIGTSAVITSTKQRASSRSGMHGRMSPSSRQDSTSSYDPRDKFHRSPNLDTESMTFGIENPEPVIDVAKVGTVAKASMSPTSSPTMRAHKRVTSNISQMMDMSKSEAPVPASEEPTAAPAPALSAPIPIPGRKPSPSSAASGPESKPASRSWTTFFKRSSRERKPFVPSSFSNTSRDSMQNGPGRVIGYTPMRSTSNIPKRTMSKFREDLPELPVSPPDSRMQSLEVDAVPPIREYPDKKIQLSDDPRVRYDTPTSGLRSLKREETPISYRSIAAPSPEPIAVMSQSLASIDSEGSWLSGRKGRSKRNSPNLPSKRSSSNLPNSHPLRESASSLDQKYKEYLESHEELGIAEDNYFSRLTPGPEDQYRIHQRLSQTMPSSDEEDGGSIVSPTSKKSKWGAVARTPTVVHREPRAKSREGLLNDYSDAASYDSEGDLAFETAQESVHASRRKSYGFDQELEDEVSSAPGVRRARSVDFGKGHVRRISAGSAKILDLKKSDSNQLTAGIENDKTTGQ